MFVTEDDGIEYKLEFSIDDESDSIHFKIIENNVYSPFTFEAKFALDDFINNHPTFSACDNLEEIIYHLNNLYKDNKIKLSNCASPKERILNFNVYNISEEVTTEDFSLKLIMTEKKDEALDDLYKIQKNQIELLKKIKSITEKDLVKQNPLYKGIIKLFEECNSKIL